MCAVMKMDCSRFALPNRARKYWLPKGLPPDPNIEPWPPLELLAAAPPYEVPVPGHEDLPATSAAPAICLSGSPPL